MIYFTIISLRSFSFSNNVVVAKLRTLLPIHHVRLGPPTTNAKRCPQSWSIAKIITQFPFLPCHIHIRIYYDWAIYLIRIPAWHICNTFTKSILPCTYKPQISFAYTQEYDGKKYHSFSEELTTRINWGNVNLTSIVFRWYKCFRNTLSPLLKALKTFDYF